MRIDLPLEDLESAFIVTATRKGLRTVFVVARYRRLIRALHAARLLRIIPSGIMASFKGGSKG